MNGELIAPMTYEEMMTSDFLKLASEALTNINHNLSVIIMDNARFHRMGS